MPKSKKGHNSVKMNFRVTALGQNIALMMVNKCVKFDEATLRDKKVIGKVKVSDAQTDRQTDTQTGQKQYAPDLHLGA